MTNTSATGGYLVPSDTPILDDALNDLFHDLFVGITTFDPTLVRPRWQETPPAMPANTVEWLAFGIRESTADEFPYVEHNSDGNGSDTVQQNEEFEVFCSFYGPNSLGNGSRLRAGLCVAQNREALKTSGIFLVGFSRLTSAPELINNYWYRRYDLTVTFRRGIGWTYPVLNILSADGGIVTDVPAFNEPIDVTND